MSFADVAVEGRRRKLESKRGRHLAMIDELVPWEDFRPVLETVWRKPKRERKSTAGRKPWDAVLMFKAVVLGALYNLSDEALEHEIGDRLTFMRFLGLGLQDRTPDATTVWQYRERLAKAGIVEELFDRFDSFLRARGYQAKGGQIVDASIVEVPRQGNSKGENAEIKAGEIPEGWAEGCSNRLAQKDLDARWTKKGGMSYYGYKNHVSTDRRYKLVRCYAVTDASVHDSQVIEKILDPDNTAAKVWADKAYRSEEIEEMLEELGLQEHDHAEGVTEQEADQAREAGQRYEGQSTGARGACLRSAGERHGRHDAAQHRGHAGTDAHRAEELGLQHAEAHSLGSCRRGQSLAASPCRQATRKARSAATNLATADPTRAVHRLKRPAAPQPSVNVFNQTSRPPHNHSRSVCSRNRRGGNKSRCPPIRGKCFPQCNLDVARIEGA